MRRTRASGCARHAAKAVREAPQAGSYLTATATAMEESMKSTTPASNVKRERSWMKTDTASVALRMMIAAIAKHAMLKDHVCLNVKRANSA